MTDAHHSSSTWLMHTTLAWKKQPDFWQMTLFEENPFLYILGMHEQPKIWKVGSLQTKSFVKSQVASFKCCDTPHVCAVTWLIDAYPHTHPMRVMSHTSVLTHAPRYTAYTHIMYVYIWYIWADNSMRITYMCVSYFMHTTLAAHVWCTPL